MKPIFLLSAIPLLFAATLCAERSFPSTQTLLTPEAPEAGAVDSRAVTIATSTSPQQVVFTSTPTPPPSPLRLIIPAIKLDVPIVAVGVNDKGEMDVPSGKTNQVGWYQAGARPGTTGSAVIDAHVFAAFKNLHKVHVGDEIYVAESDGEKLRFKVTRTVYYPYDQVPLELLFNRADGRYLNLITCAGTWLPNRGTYSKRLVVYTELVNT